MKYYFLHKSDLIYLKTDTLAEYARLVKLPYIRKNKTKTIFAVNIRYLINLINYYGVLLPQKPEDKIRLKKLIKKIRYIASLEEQLKYEGFDYSQYLRKEKIKLYPFQKIGIEYLTKVKTGILADDVGLGKTIQTITALCHFIKTKQINEKIIIVTKSSVKYQWKSAVKDFVNFDVVPELKKKVVIVEGNRKERKALYQSDAKVFLMNYEQFIFDYPLIVQLTRDVDGVVLDEASKIKNITAKRTQKIKTLLYHCPIKLLLTATPIENKLIDLYSLAEFVDRGTFVNFKWFKKKYCDYMTFKLGRNGPVITKLKGYRNLDDAKQKIRGLYLRRTAEMVGVQLPKFIVQLRLVDLLPTQRKEYNNVKKDISLSNMAKVHILHRICNEFKDANKSPKIDELVDLLENETTDEKLVVFSKYRTFTNVLYKKLKKKYGALYIHGGTAAKQREKFRVAFNKKQKHRVLIMTTAGEEGVDLPSASILVNMDLPENPSRLKQRCGRIRRLSSKYKTVRIINILSKDTIEEKTVKLIFKKISLFIKFFSEDTPNLVSKKSFHKGIENEHLEQIV